MDGKTRQVSVNSTFKLFILAILFFLTGIQISSTYFHISVIPVIASVITAFFCLVYLWINELLDREHILKTNLELMLTQNMLKAAQIDIILALVLSQESKDRYTHGHSERVTKYSVRIAEELGLPEEEIEIIKRAGKLHDIGKVGIKDDILFSSEELSDDEYSIIKTHPAKGANIMEPLKFLDREKEIVRHHHERFDGDGYPDRLKGEDIPLGARIMAVADAFDAMKSERLYKKGFSKGEIVKEFQDNSGKQFDPKITVTFLKIIDTFYA